MVSKIASTSTGARPIDGSSSRSTFGFDISARPIASICCSPPLSVPAIWVRRSRSRGNISKARVDAVLDLLFRHREPAHLQVLLDGQAGEGPAALGHLDDARGDDLVRGDRTEVPSVEANGPGARADDPGDRVEGGRLARAVGADERDDLALLDRQRHALEGVDVAVVGVDVVDFEQRHRQTVGAPGSPGFAALALAALGDAEVRRAAAPEVGLDDAWVRLDLGGVALGDLLAVVEHRDALRDAHDHPHLVLDEEDRDPQLVAQVPDEVGQLGRLRGVHARRRLVEEEQARLVGERPADLEPALVAIRAACSRACRPCRAGRRSAAGGRPRPVPASRPPGPTSCRAPCRSRSSGDGGAGRPGCSPSRSCSRTAGCSGRSVTRRGARSGRGAACGSAGRRAGSRPTSMS